jgi:hypothetical protein
LLIVTAVRADNRKCNNKTNLFRSKQIKNHLQPHLIYFSHMKQKRATERIGPWSSILLVGWFLLSHLSAQGQVSGYVFRDFNADGVRTASKPIEPGVSGATVRVYVDIDPTPRTTTTAADGTYSFNATQVPPGLPLRVEFFGFETGYYTGPFGAGSGTTVQFVTSGTSATAVNAGINYPADYCQANPPVITPCYVNGNPISNIDNNGNIITDASKKSGNQDVLVAVPFGVSGLAGSSPGNTPFHLATGAEIGAVWGVAFQRRTSTIFSSATMKRHSGFGPLGTGGIYITNVSATSITNGTSSSFIDVRTIGIDTGADSRTILSGKKNEASRDVVAMTAVGRAAIGGLDFSEDDKSLFFMNLNDRKLYNVFIDIPARAPKAADVKSWTLADPGCVQGVFRPWAVRVYRGRVYVGGVCSGENVNTSTVADPDHPDFGLAIANQDKLRGYVYSMNPNDGPTAQFKQELSFPLSFTRGYADIDCQNYKYWFPWTDKFPNSCNPDPTNPNPPLQKAIWPQPLITSLVFDDDGSLLVGMLDRFGFLAGNRNQSPIATDNVLYDGFTGGDLLRAQRNTDGTFTLESNGTSGPYTNPAGQNVSKGPGGGVFFSDVFWLFGGKLGHDQILNGALAYVPGSGEVFSSAFDPYYTEDPTSPNYNNVFRAGGFKILNPRTGRATRSFALYYETTASVTAENGTFGKAAGLGDAKGLCIPAPLEIGNRIWYDDNRNGIQDAYEKGVDGLVLTLHDMDNGGALVGTQTTKNGGQFYFNNTTLAPAILLPSRKYEIWMTSDQFPTIDLSKANNRGGRAAAGTRQYFVSPANQGNPLTNSKGVLDGSVVKIAVTTGDFGQNAHIADASIYSCPVLTLTTKTFRVCQGQPAPNSILDGAYFSRVDKLRFVVFDTKQSGTDMYNYTNSQVLAEFSPTSWSTSAPESFTLNGSLIPTTGGNKYVYAVISPAPSATACRPYDETVIEIIPTPVVSATGGQITCSVKSVTLTSTATDSKGNSLTSTPNYSWTGPNGFTANTRNVAVSAAGSYTLSVSTAECLNTFGKAVALVTSDTAVPSLTLTATPSKTAAVGESVTLTASGCTGGTLTLSTPFVVTVVEGINLYSATCTNGSGCSATASVSVTGLVKSLTVKAQSVCIKDTPFISYTVTAVNFVPQNGVTITIRKFADNSIVDTKTNQPFTGSFLYTGARIDAQGNPIDWPGWDLINDEWVMVDDGLRPYLKVSFTVNPTTEANIDYPAPTSACISGPLHGLGDRVWKDNNNNGIQDSGEPGIPNFKVELYEVINGVRSTSALSTTTTNGQGYYLFPDLPFGSYQVRFVPSSIPANSQPSPAFAGIDRTIDSNANPTTGFSDVIVLSSTDAKRPNRTVDAGFAPCVPTCIPMSTTRIR